MKKLLLISMLLLVCVSATDTDINDGITLIDIDWTEGNDGISYFK